MANLDLFPELGAMPRPQPPALMAPATPLAILVGLRMVGPKWRPRVVNGAIHFPATRIADITREWRVVYIPPANPKGNIAGQWLVRGMAR